MPAKRPSTKITRYSAPKIKSRTKTPRSTSLKAEALRWISRYLAKKKLQGPSVIKGKFLWDLAFDDPEAFQAIGRILELNGDDYLDLILEDIPDLPTSIAKTGRNVLLHWASNQGEIGELADMADSLEDEFMIDLLDTIKIQKIKKVQLKKNEPMSTVEEINPRLWEKLIMMLNYSKKDIRTYAQILDNKYKGTSINPARGLLDHIAKDKKYTVSLFLKASKLVRDDVVRAFSQDFKFV